VSFGEKKVYTAIQDLCLLRKICKCYLGQKCDIDTTENYVDSLLNCSDRKFMIERTKGVCEGTS